MTRLSSSRELTPKGVDLPESSWNGIFKLVVKQTPILSLTDGINNFKARLLADVSKETEGREYIIEEIEKELSREILENKRRLLVRSRYFDDGLLHKISFNARLSSYTIFMGYPALILHIIPPVKQVSSLMIAYPAKDRPVYFEIPVKGAPTKIQVSEFSKEYLKISSKELGKSLFKTGYVEDVRVQFYDLAEVCLAGNLTAPVEDVVKFEFKPEDENVNAIINDYLAEEFNETIISVEELEKINDKKKPDQIVDAKKHILIVDDEPDIFTPLKVLLEEQGIRVSMAHTGRDGLQEAFSKKPDLILLDINMPDIDGLTVLSRLREYSTTQAVPVLMSTARAELDVVIKAKEMGISGYIKKPYVLKDLFNRVMEELKLQV